MGTHHDPKKVVRIGRKPRFGGDPLVDRNGISTENHMEMFARLVRAGREGMHNPPKERVKRSH